MRNALTRTLVLVVVASALQGGVAVRAAADKLVFNWPVPGRALVTERVLRRGRNATLSYEVAVARAPDGMNLTIALENLHFTAVEGMNLRDPRVQKELAPALELAAKVPPLVVSPEGRFLDFIDFEAMLDRMIGTQPAGADRDAIEKLMKSKEMIGSLKQKSSEFWKAWVAVWVGHDLKPGRKVPVDVDLSFGVASGVIQHHGRAGGKTPPGSAGLVRLTLDSSFGGKSDDKKAFASLVEAFLAPLRAQLGREAPPPEVEDLRVVTHVEAVTDPRTLRPASARFSRESTVTMGGESRSDVERHEYAFVWKGGD